MMKVAIATASSEKIEGILMGFSRFFQIENSNISVFYRKMDSGVSKQPFDAETYAGARNRVDRIRNIEQKYDYYVSCEAGIESYADLFFNVQVICIYEEKTGKYLFGKSAGWQVPTKDIQKIKENTIDHYLREKGFKSSEELLGLQNSRKEAIANATELALVSKRF